MHEYYEILGISENATDEEVFSAYSNLKSKYSKDRFLEGEAGNKAAKKLTKIETAYSEIMNERNSFNTDSTSYTNSEKSVSDEIKAGNLDKAQKILDDDTNRDAEWHYLQSVIFYKKGWMSESKKQLEIAISLDPTNEKYKDSLDKLNGKINTANEKFHSGNANYGNKTNPNDYGNRQMGGEGCSNCADCCTAWCCTEIMCNICCR